MAKKIKEMNASESSKVILPLMANSKASEDEYSTTRRNKAASIERTNNYTNIWNGVDPFLTGASSGISVRDSIVLCQKAYYNFSSFRNTIDLMTEFSISTLLFRGGSKKARDFFNALKKKVFNFSLQDMFFREYYRSANVFLLRLDVGLTPEAIKGLTQVFGLKTSNAKKIYLPAKYIMLNPADIEAAGTVGFFNAKYYKVLTSYELARLKKPVTEEDRNVLEALPAESRKAIKKGGMVSIQIPLDPAKVLIVFYKKQSYEPMAVPMGYPVLSDINWKSEMRKMDMAVTRTMQQAILLITMGAEPDKGGTNPDALKRMQELFQNESVGRVLVADFTTKAQFVIPDIAAFLDPKKYEAVDRDIRLGLNNVLFGEGEKFANQNAKVQVFIERLKQGREAFISDFLLPEVKRISEEMGFQNYPTPYLADIDLKDSLEYAKLYTRLVEIGALTVEEGIEAIETGMLPNKTESIENQIEFRALKDKGLYQPIVGGPADNLKLAQTKVTMAPPKLSGPAGRPKGTKQKQSTKKVSPIGANERYSASKVMDHLALAQKLQSTVEEEICKTLKTKELSESSKETAKEVVEVILANEDPKNWFDKVKEYIKNPWDKNQDRVQKVQEIAYAHQLDPYLASILFASKIEDAK